MWLREVQVNELSMMRRVKKKVELERKKKRGKVRERERK